MRLYRTTFSPDCWHGFGWSICHCDCVAPRFPELPESSGSGSDCVGERTGDGSMNVRPLYVIWCLVALCAGFPNGCCKARLGVEHPVIRDSHGVFNPAESRVTLADSARSDWPVAYLPDSTGEETQYNLHFVDIQGRGSNRDDGFLFRRFESDRFGRSRR